MSDPLSVIVDEEKAIAESRELREILPPYDSLPEIPELLELRQIRFPENKNLTMYSKNLHSQYVLSSLLQNLQFEDEKLQND